MSEKTQRHVRDASDQPVQRWTRWRPQAIDAVRAGTPLKRDVPPENASADAQAALGRLQEHARREGRAQGYADGLKAGTEQGLAEGRLQGEKEGFAAGQARGYAEGRQRAEQEGERFAALAQECARALTALESEMGQALVDLAVRIAEHVLHTTLDARPDTICDLVAGVLREQAGQATMLQIYVHPTDAQRVQDYIRQDADGQLWRVLPDKTITPGGCRVRTALGDIDATLETRWKRAVASLGSTS